MNAHVTPKIGYYQVQTHPGQSVQVGRDKQCTCGGTAQHPCPHIHAVADYLPAPMDVPPVVGVVPGSEEIVERPGDPGAPLCASVFKIVTDPHVGHLAWVRVFSGHLKVREMAHNPRADVQERVGRIYRMHANRREHMDHMEVGDVMALVGVKSAITGDTLCDPDHPIVLELFQFPEPVIAVALSPSTDDERDRLRQSVARLCEEDPTLSISFDPETREQILSGMGESHVEIAARRLHQKFGVNITTSVPKVPYRETITKTASAQGRHKKQTGGRGQFGDVFIRFEPLPRGSGFEFEDEIRSAAVPNQYIPAVEKGLREIIQKGILANYPTTDFRAVLYDGSYHSVDSSEIAFKLAAHLAFKKGIPEASPVLLEPIMDATITIPEEFTGDVLGDLNSKRARVQGMDQQRGMAVITAQAPLAEMQRYATDLRSITQGRGIYTMEFSHYEEVPSHVAQKISEEAKREAES